MFAVDGSGVAVFSETDSPTEDARVPLSSQGAYELGAGEGAIWGATEDSLEKIDPASLTSTSSVLLNDLDGAGRLAVGGGYVFVARYNGLTRLDPATGQEQEFKGLEVDAVDDDAAWGDLGESGFLVRSNPDTLAEEARVRLPDYSFDVEIGEEKVWAVTADSSLVGIDPSTNAVVVGPADVPTSDVEVGTSVLDAAAGLGGVWVGDGHSLTVHRFDPVTGELTDSLALAGGESASFGDVFVTVGRDAVWATSNDPGGTSVTLTRIDPGSASSSDGTATAPGAQPLTPADQDEMDGAAQEFILSISGGPTSSILAPPAPDEETCTVNAPPLTNSTDADPATEVAGTGYDTCIGAATAAYDMRCVPEYSGGEATGDSQSASFTASITAELRDKDGRPRNRGSAQITLEFVKPLNDWLIDGTTPTLAEVCEQIES